MKLYSKDSVTVPLKAMAENDRFVHSYIITGESGVGKKTAAKYIAMQMMCDTRSACGECRQCRRILKDQHPDFIMARKVRGKYSMAADENDSIRKTVVEDCYITPNDCDRKVYVLYDVDGWQPQCQDVMLKITEEPPDHAYFIFTGSSKGVFKDTVISRSMVMEITEATREECLEALREYTPSEENADRFTEENMLSAVESFGGNIGRCIDWLEGNEMLMKAADVVRTVAKSLVSHDEYTLAKTLCSLEKDRQQAREVFSMLQRVIRDSAVIRCGREGNTGCAHEESVRIAERFSTERIGAMYEAVDHASDCFTKNCNQALSLSALAARLGNI